MLLSCLMIVTALANLSHCLLLLLLLLLLSCNDHHLLSHLHRLTATSFRQWLWTNNRATVNVLSDPYSSAVPTEKWRQCEKHLSWNALPYNLLIFLLTHCRWAMLLYAFTGESFPPLMCLPFSVL